MGKVSIQFLAHDIWRRSKIIIELVIMIFGTNIPKSKSDNIQINTWTDKQQFKFPYSFLRVLNCQVLFSFWLKTKCVQIFEYSHQDFEFF